VLQAEWGGQRLERKERKIEKTESRGSDWLLHGSVWLAKVDSVTANGRKGRWLTSVMIMG
jgi:hypothetical protein